MTVPFNQVPLSIFPTLGLKVFEISWNNKCLDNSVTITLHRYKSLKKKKKKPCADSV